MSDNAESYMLEREVPIVGGSAGAFSNNLSVSMASHKNLTYAAVVNKDQVHTISWDSKFEWMIHNVLPARDISPGRNNKKAKFCTLRNRSTPLLVICSVAGAAVCDIVSASIIYWLPAPEENCMLWRCMKGVACRRDRLFIGSHTGHVYQLLVRGDIVDSVGYFKELKNPVMDIATNDSVLVSVSMLGVMAIYKADPKNSDGDVLIIHKVINAGLSINRVVVYKGLVFCGTMTGQIVAYDMNSGDISLEINAHSQPVTDLDVSDSTDQIISTSEDSFIRIWRIGNVREGQTGCCFSTNIPNVPLVGGCFVDSDGSTFVASGYDYSALFYFTQRRESGVESGKGFIAN
uniref:WD_REPEATS_REGION domain-containing protein n=1 Tax=Trichuris muris TaxID=70415 RepID=A0A5S6QHA8_TRIMR